MPRTAAAIALQLVLTAVASASAVFLEPPTTPELPFHGQPVFARVHDNAACVDYPIAVVQTDNVIELRYAEPGCPILPIGGDQEVPLGNLPEGAYDLRLVEISDPQHPLITDEAILEVQPPGCPGDELCLLGGRIGVSATWQIRGGASGVAHPVRMTDETGAFWFFSDQNLELMVKALDACTVNGAYWIYAGGLTDVQVSITVRDRGTAGPGEVRRTYVSPFGPFELLRDTDTFRCVTPPVR